MPGIVYKLDYRIRQTSEYVYCQNPCNGSIMNLSKVDLLFSVYCQMEYQNKVERTIKLTFNSIMAITIAFLNENQIIRCLSQWLSVRISISYFSLWLLANRIINSLSNQNQYGYWWLRFQTISLLICWMIIPLTHY